MFYAYAGIFYCSNENPDSDLCSQSSPVDGGCVHNDGADDHSVSREYFPGRHRVNKHPSL